MTIKTSASTLLAIVSAVIFAGEPIDIVDLPFTNETHIVAIDVQVNPTNMPDSMLWDKPILLLYKQVDSFDNIRADVVRAELTADFDAGNYHPVVLRAYQKSSLTIHFMNLIGMGDAPVRFVQGAVCKNCKALKAYNFSYGPAAEQSQYPFLASIHAHGVNYTIEHDGTNAGTNPLNDPNNYGLVAPGESRSYHYRELDYIGVWPLHDHANPSHTVGRGLHMALIVEPKEPKIKVDHDFMIIFSDYPDYDAYLDEFYLQTFIPPFLHMTNRNLMHAHAFNGYAAMLPPRMKMSVMAGGTKWDAMRTDIIGEPRTPVFETQLGDLVRFRFMSMGSSITHSFHLHAHIWYDYERRRYVDNVAIPAGDTKEMMFYAGGYPFRGTQLFADQTDEDGSPKVRSGTGDWLYHCHIIPHVKHGMWGIFRVNPNN